MELRIGLYEFFAYTLAGVCYFLALAALNALYSSGAPLFDAYGKLSAVQFVAAGAAAYVTGLVVDPLARLLLRLIHKHHAQKIVAKGLYAKGIVEEALATAHWELVLAELHVLNPAMLRNADSYKAASILLRNFGLASAIVLVGAACATYVGHVAASAGIPLACFACILWICSTAEARKFDKWFYSTIYERITALRHARPREGELLD